MTKQILFMLLTSILSTPALTAQEAAAVPITYNVGTFGVTTLTDAQNQMNAGVLIGATDEMLSRYLKDGKANGAINAFLVETSDRTILVDAGLGNKLVDNLKTYGKTPDDIDVILLTHLHGDHIGGLLRDGKKVFTKAEVYVSQAEYNYWTNETILKGLPENKRGGFARAVEAMKAYKDKLHFFVPTEAGKQLLPGISAVEAYGHTPGHTAFLLESDGSQLLIWGDVTHLTPIQIPCPQLAVTYDVDPTVAIASRKRILQFVASKKIRVAGMHIEYPGIGDIKGDADKGYSFSLTCKCEGTVK
ncbi:MAG: MBL fold metallo-hydrolase [Tannerella sp.]|jgi:glyoxylase-like metal-dependent hydrolase (beta-lactamase superfamily II)|nr:MBL fold metallo-hydrolase [Tannerella sp.]